LLLRASVGKARKEGLCVAFMPWIWEDGHGLSLIRGLSFFIADFSACA
jgi:hypothetical protein